MLTPTSFQQGVRATAGSDWDELAGEGLGTWKGLARADTLRTPTMTVSVAHEVGSWPEDQVLEKDLLVPPAPYPTHVRVKSHIVAGGARALRSPPYLASVRRRAAKKIARLIRGLPDADDDFVVWTQEPLQQLRRLIGELSDAEEGRHPKHEGNSCEIFRQLRDTFLNQGWRRYREPAVRELAIEILENLANADEVSADDAFDAADRLFDANLNPVAGKLLDDGPEEPEVSG